MERETSTKNSSTSLKKNNNNLNKSFINSTSEKSPSLKV